MTSCKSTEAFYNKIEASDKKLSLYEVRIPGSLGVATVQVTLLWLTQGGYHELVNEIDDIPDRFTDEVLTWIEDHVPKPNTPNSKL